jgi:hypothetical protein
VIAIAVLAHRAPAQVAGLVAALQHRDVQVYVHLDARVDARPFEQALRDAGDPEVSWVSRHAAPWGGPGVVDATVDAIRAALDDGAGYFFLVSGQDRPLRSIDGIVRFAEAAGDRSYLTHWPFPVAHWRGGGRDRIEFYSYYVRGRRETCVPRGEDVSHLNGRGRVLNSLLRLRTLAKPHRRVPPYVTPFGGDQWLNLSRPAMAYVLDFVAGHPDYRRYHEHTLLPDEIFFQTILAGTEFAERHELMNDSLRFMKWSHDATHPVVITRADLAAMRASSALFARKFDEAVDAEVIAELAEAVRS